MAAESQNNPIPPPTFQPSIAWTTISAPGASLTVRTSPIPASAQAQISKAIESGSAPPPPRAG